MYFDPNQKLKKLFEQFPGIGPRQAARFVYWLLGEDFSFIRELSDLLLELKKNTKQCGKCFRYFTPAPQAQAVKSAWEFTSLAGGCGLCQNSGRDSSRILIVEKDIDLENIEKTGVYDGRYFVLGNIVPLDQKMPKNIRLKELFNRAEKELKKELKEIILALNATAEGDNTSRYIGKILEPLVTQYSLKISRFGRGLSTGTELEYIDSDTLKNALENRK